MVVLVKEYYRFPLVFGFWKEKISAGCFLMDFFFIRCFTFFLFPRTMFVDMVNIYREKMETYCVRVTSVD